MLNEKLMVDKYSTSTTIKTNKLLDGKPIYRSYIEFAHSNVGTYTYTHNLGIETIVSIDAFCSVSGQTISTNGFREMPMVNTSNGYMFGIDTFRENTITTSAIGWQNNHAYIWVEYTKTS